MSAGLPRDRRGRIAEKPEKQSFLRHYGSGDTFVDGAGEETPRIGTGFSTERERDVAREKEREFLESLRYELDVALFALSLWLLMLVVCNVGVQNRTPRALVLAWADGDWATA